MNTIQSKRDHPLGVLFGSCNRQNLPQSHWETMLRTAKLRSLSPEYFFWTGDAVYAKGQSLADVQLAYDQLLKNPYYGSFIHHLTIDGIWDDHDYGINDGGRFVANKTARGVMFMNFLGSGRPVRGKVESIAARITEREGLYHSRTVKNRAGGGVAKFIFLDTRFMRDHHFVQSLGEINAPLTALIAAAFRTFYTVLGFGRTYDGDVLGEKQWKWLESELSVNNTHAPIDYHVIVSSIQVFTSNPVFESWGHFPVAKRRLVDLLSRTDPSGLLVLSGDVHLAESITVTSSGESEDCGKREWLEVTSSGFTHSAADGLLNKLLCPLMLSTFSRHRHSSKNDTVFVGNNFGLISFDKSILNVTVFSIPRVGAGGGEPPVIHRTKTPHLSTPGRGACPVDVVDFPILSSLSIFFLVVFLSFCLSLSPLVAKKFKLWSVKSKKVSKLN